MSTYARLMKNTISLPVAPAEPPTEATTQSTVPPSNSAAAAESERTKTRDRVMESLNPKARAVLEKKAQAAKAAATAPTPAAPATVQQPAAAASAPTKPEGSATPGDDTKGQPAPDAGVIDFSKLGETTKTDDEDAPPAELTDAELADLNTVKTKLTDAHKDNARLRKDRREAREAKEQLEARLKEIEKQLQEAQAATGQASNSGRYLDRFDKVEDVQRAREDALEALRQLQEDPARETVTLPGNRIWKMLDGKGNHIGASAAETALEILDGYDDKVKQLNGRVNAEKTVASKLPLLSKMLPELEARYRELMVSDWQASAPELSLNAALGELVTSGKYIMQPVTRAAAKPAPKADPKPAAELPSTPPPAREVTTTGAHVDVSEVKAKALKGDKRALAEWIRLSGKSKAAA